MQKELQAMFLRKWEEYFGDSELPITFYLSDGEGGAERVPAAKGRSCLICELAKVRKGQSLCYGPEALACGGAKRYLGYAPDMRPGFDYFLSCGKPGEIEGERYIQTPEMVRTLLQNQTEHIPSEGKHFIFKRWDRLAEQDMPEVVIFFAKPDVLSGLYTLANFDQTDPNGTFTPFASGCGSIIYYPYLETGKERPRAVLGMFDPSARPCVGSDTLTFSVPMARFECMVRNMDESFLITETWTKVKKRIARSASPDR